MNVAISKETASLLAGIGAGLLFFCAAIIFVVLVADWRLYFWRLSSCASSLLGARNTATRTAMDRKGINSRTETVITESFTRSTTNSKRTV